MTASASASGATASTAATSMINISIGDCHPFDINKSIRFHRILGGGNTLAATDGLDNFEYLIVNSTTNEVKHYTPLVTGKFKADNGFVVDSTGVRVFGLSCFVTKDGNNHGAPISSHFQAPLATCVTNNDLDIRLGMVVDKFQTNRLDKKARKTFEVLHCSVFPKEERLTKDQFIQAFINSGTWCLCNLIGSGNGEQLKEYRDDEIEEERKVSDLDVNTSRLCALLSKIIQSGSHGPPKYNSKLYRALVDTINLINNSKLNFEVLLGNQLYNLSICVLLDALDMRYEKSESDSLRWEIGHFQSIFLHRNDLLSGDYELVNVSYEVNAALTDELNKRYHSRTY